MLLNIILSKPTFVDHYVQMACRVHIISQKEVRFTVSWYRTPAS